MEFKWQHTLRRVFACASITATAVSGGALAASAAQAKSHAKAPKSAGTLDMAVQGTLNTFDPWGAGTGLNGNMLTMGAVYESLLDLTKTGKLAPGLATSWTTVGAKKIKMNLRHGVKFADGSTLTAGLVKRNFKYAVADKTPGQCNVDLDGVSVQTRGKYALTLHLAKGNPDLLLDLATCAGYIVGPKGLSHPSSLTAEPDGSGPYTYDASASVQNQKWVFVKKKKPQWDSAAFPFSKVIRHFYPTQAAQDDASHSGQIQFAQVEPLTDTATGLKFYKAKPNLFRGMMLGDLNGTIVPALANVKVRQAMNYAVNRKPILDALYKGDGYVDAASSPFAPGMQGYTSKLKSFYTYNPTKAKQLLAEAGYPHGFTLPVMDSPTDTNQAILEAIAGNEQAIGIKMTVTPNNTTFIPTMVQGKTPAYFAQFTLGGGSFTNLLGLASSTAFWNAEHFSNKTFNKLIYELRSATGARATKLYEQFAVAFARQAWFVAPVILPNVAGYDAKKIHMVITNENPCPMLYQITPA